MEFQMQQIGKVSTQQRDMDHKALKIGQGVVTVSLSLPSTSQLQSNYVLKYVKRSIDVMMWKLSVFNSQQRMSSSCFYNDL
ncbi:hypothetical protein SCA6_019738 [Theobroma cacao]